MEGDTTIEHNLLSRLSEDQKDQAVVLLHEITQRYFRGSMLHSQEEVIERLAPLFRNARILFLRHEDTRVP